MPERRSPARWQASRGFLKPALETAKEVLALLQLIEKSATARWTAWSAIGALWLFGVGYLLRSIAELVH